MCENCDPVNPEIVEAYETFNQAMKTFLEKLDLAEGIVVDWVLVLSQNIMFKHNTSTMTCWIPQLDQPTYRTKGLLHEVIDSSRASDIAHKTVKHLQD